MVLLFRVGDIVRISSSDAPECCKGKKGEVQHVTKFGSCSVYIAELRETYLLNPTSIALEKTKTDAPV